MRRMMSLTPYGEALWTGGAGTTYDLMMRLAGQENASAEAGLEGNVQLRLEELLELDPDVILTGMGSGAAGLEHLRDHPTLGQLKAVQEERFVRLPAYLVSTSSHEILTAAEALAEGLRALGD